MSDIIDGRYKKIKCLSSNEQLQQLTFLVEDTQIPGRKYVAKLYADIENESQEKEFRQNIDILSNPAFEDNPGVSKLRHTGEDGYVRYLIFDYVSGKSLKEVIEQDGKLDSEKVERLVEEILIILKPIHEAKFVHRDIKPSNIIIREDGKVILIDFDAVARLDTPQLGTTTATAFTSGYAPPEQKLGFMSPQNDLYALGMTAIKALTATSPHSFERESNGQMDLPSNLSMGYRLEAVLVTLTHEIPLQRYCSCSEVLDALIRTKRTERVVPLADDNYLDKDFENYSPNSSSPWYGNIGIGKIAILCLVFMTGSFAWGYITVQNYLSLPDSSEVPLADKPINRPSRDNPERIGSPSIDNENSQQNDLPTEEEIPQLVQPSTPKVFLGRNGSLATKSDTDENSQLDFNNSDVPTEEKPASVSENSDSGHWFVDGRQK